MELFYDEWKVEFKNIKNKHIYLNRKSTIKRVHHKEGVGSMLGWSCRNELYSITECFGTRSMVMVLG